MMKDLIPGCPNSGHNTIRDHTREWLQQHIKRCVFLLEKGLGMVSQDSLLVKTQKKVDILAKQRDDDRALGIVQIEIVSDKDLIATINKLGYGLIDQLKFIRNCGFGINEIIGFVVPVEIGFVVKVVCRWNDDACQFYLEPENVKKSEVISEVEGVYKVQMPMMFDCICANRSRFTIPLCPLFITRALQDEGAYQLNSSMSFHQRKMRYINIL